MKKVVFSVTGVILNEDGLILTSSRKETGHLLYGFVGGKVGDGESLENALIREIGEETSLTVAKEDLKKIHEGCDDYGSYVSCFLIKYNRDVHGEPVAELGYKIKWMSAEDLMVKSPFKKYNDEVLKKVFSVSS